MKKLDHGNGVDGDDDNDNDDDNDDSVEASCPSGLVSPTRWVLDCGDDEDSTGDDYDGDDEKGCTIDPRPIINSSLFFTRGGLASSPLKRAAPGYGPRVPGMPPMKRPRMPYG